MQITYVKTKLNGVPCLVPYKDYDRDLFEKIKYEVPVIADTKKDRNPKFHAKLMAILRFIVNNSEKWDSVDQLLVALKYKLGLVDFILGFDGKVVANPKSIAFKQMDNFEFDMRVYTPAIPILSKETGIPENELEGIE